MRLVSNARQGWKWVSVQSMAAAMAVQGTWVALPDDMKASLPDWAVSAATMALLVLGTIGRFVDQQR